MVKRIKFDEGKEVLGMQKERLEELQRNSKSAYKYMESIEKEYLTGKTILDQKIFIDKLKENHSVDEIIYLYNEMIGHKESYLSFTNGFFGIVIPIYVAIFAFIGVLSSGLITFISNMSEKIIDIKIENKDTNFDDAITLFNQVSSDILTTFGILIIVILTILLIMLWKRHKNGNKRLQYLAWLNSIKEINNLIK